MVDIHIRLRKYFLRSILKSYKFDLGTKLVKIVPYFCLDLLHCLMPNW